MQTHHGELDLFDAAKGPVEQEPVKRDNLTESLVAIEGHAQLLWSVTTHRSVEGCRDALKAWLNT